MRTLKQIALDFQRQHPILYCLILMVIVVVIVPGIIIGIMSFQGSLDYPYEFLQPWENVAHIRLIRVEEGIGLYNHPLEEIPSMLDEAGNPVTELDPSAHITFLGDFVSIPCHRTGMDPSSYIEDGTILITYQDGSREWIANFGTFYQDLRSGEASMTRFYFDEEAFSALLRSYGYQ